MKTVGGLVSTIFGGADTPTPPPIEKPPVMPTPNDDLVKQQKKKAVAALQARSGRAATIFTGNDDALG